jgi:hypothetical protein
MSAVESGLGVFELIDLSGSLRERAVGGSRDIT